MNITTIAEAVANRAGLTADDILGHYRRPDIVAARHEYFHTASRWGFSQAQIADSRRIPWNVTSVIYGIKKAREAESEMPDCVFKSVRAI